MGEMSYTGEEGYFRVPAYKARRRRKFEPNLVFVAMPIKQRGMSTVYAIIKEECAKLGLDANRVDENVGAVSIVEEVVNLIKLAEFIIFDLTYERPNVYYELGYAQGIGNGPLDILLIAKEGVNLHFDIAALRVQFYQNHENLRAIIKRNLKAMMLVTRKIAKPKVLRKPSGRGGSKTRNN
jgi:hypothetical protein